MEKAKLLQELQDLSTKTTLLGHQLLQDNVPLTVDELTALGEPIMILEHAFERAIKIVNKESYGQKKRNGLTPGS